MENNFDVSVIPNINDFSNLNILTNEEQDFITNAKEANPNIISIPSNDNLELSSENFPYTLNLKINEFSSEKELIKFIHKVKGMVRSSFEYKLWVDFITTSLQHNKCALSKESAYEITVELHHHPISIQNIITAVINTHIDNGDYFSSFDIASEVMNLHYQMKVGVIPLITSLHEKFHNGFLDLPIDLVIGDWKYLLDNYTFSDEQKELINRYQQFTINNCLFYTSCKLNKTNTESCIGT